MVIIQTFSLGHSGIVNGGRKRIQHHLTEEEISVTHTLRVRRMCPNNTGHCFKQKVQPTINESLHEDMK